MVRHTQTIRRLLPMNYLSVFDHVVWLALKGLMGNFIFCKVSAALYIDIGETLEYRGT